MSDGSRARRVLVIEDDRTVTDLLRSVLTDEGFDVEVAADGLEGLLLLRAAAPDVALLDIMMPAVDGVRVLVQLLEEGEGALPVPVIVITGSPEGAARSRALLDPEDVFEKPFEPDRLVARIRAHC